MLFTRRFYNPFSWALIAKPSRLDDATLSPSQIKSVEDLSLTLSTLEEHVKSLKVRFSLLFLGNG